MSFWPETLDRWHQEGLPTEVGWRGYDENETDEYFGLDTYRSYTRYNSFLSPPFPAETLEDRGDTVLLQQSDGVRVVRSKEMSSIPHPECHLLTDRASWEKHYKHRLSPGGTDRFPAGWEEKCILWQRDQRTTPLVAEVGSLYGKLRNIMGVVEISMLLYDDLPLFEEMVETMADLAVSNVQAHVEAGIELDAFYLWEDMCFNSGPLIGPDQVRSILFPHYRRIVDACHTAGTDIICLDTDGKCDDLIPIFLDAGINVLYPIEIGTTGNDPIKLRTRFGKDLRMMGGFDKKILAKGKTEIEAEVQRLAPLVEEGGYIPMCDHYVPPDVSFENYRFFRTVSKSVWVD